MSQFHPAQHAGDNDFQMWQQQMMYKQLQEFQRQQQLQQPDHGARMQPSFGQFHAPAKPSPADQFSTMSNEMPNNEATSSAWPHNFASGDPSLTSNSQMLNNGSTNWDQFVGAPGMGNFINGSMFANAQSQSMRPMGLATHQVDQSFYPMHATSSRGSGNQYSQFLGIPADSQSAMARVGPDQSEKTSRSVQNFHGKGGFLNNSPMQSQGENIKAGSPVTMNHLQLGFQVQDFHGRPKQVDFQVGMQEKSTVQVGPASGRASLDPTEEKILFGNDEDSNWGALLRGENDHGNSLDNDNFGGAYSSLQSGSWSALMQEALQSTTSENSPKEEWSGLSFQKTDQIVANNSALLSSCDENKLAALSGTNLENARPSPASSYADGTMNNPNPTSFQHAIRTPYERRDQMPHESPSPPVINHQSTSEVNNGYFQQSLKQSQSDGRQEQVNLANGLWAHQKSELLRNNLHSTGAHATPPSAHGFWMSQQNTADHSVNRESSNNQNDWKTNNALGQGISNTPNVFNSNENSWKSSGGNANSVQRLQQMKSDISTAPMPNEGSDGKNISMMVSSMPMVTQDHYQMITGQSGEQVGMNRNMGHRVPGTSESPGRIADQRASDFNQEYLNKTPNERQAHLLNHGQHMTSDSAARRHSVFAGKESQNLGQSGQQAMRSYTLQNRSMGSSGLNIGQSPGNPVSNSPFPPQSHQMRNNLQHHFGTNSHVSSNMPSVNEEQLQPRHGIPNSSSALPFDGSDAGLSQLSQNRSVQNSQHMLQLLHKVDNSRNSNAAADIPNNSPGIVSAQQQLNHPSVQGFGLRLAPPSQRQPTLGHLWSSQTNVDGKQPDHSAQEDDLTQLPSATSQSLVHPHPNSQSSPFHAVETDNTGQPLGRFPQLSSGQQYPATEARSGPVPMLQQPQQGSSATVFKNVWTNISAQRLAGMQANKITPNILQSMMFPNNAAASNLWSSQKIDDQGQKAATPSDAATSSANSQNEDTKQAVDSDAGLAYSQKVNFDSTGATVSGGKGSLQKPSSDGNFANPVSSLAQLHQQGIMSTKLRESPGANFQNINASHNSANKGGGIVLHGSPAPSNIQQQSYSLLHQMQAMRHTDIDRGSAVGKTTKSEIGSDGSPVDWKSGQRFAQVANNSTKSSTDNVGSPGVPGSFPSDMKMLSFVSRSEERNPSIPSQLPSGEHPSHGMVTAQNDLQNQVPLIGTSAASDSVERTERPSINPQMAPSWFGHYGNYRNGQNIAMLNAQKTTTSPYNFPKASWNIDNNSAEHRVESGQSVRPGHFLSSTRMQALVPSNVKATSTMRRPKKRKSTESALVSWHKIIESPQKLRNISAYEMDWAWAANRLIEKDEAETLDDAPLNYLPRKRLILTTQLIQQLLPAIPATVIRAQAVSAYESAAYTLSMLTLRDACSMASSSLYNSCSLVDDENNPSEQTTSAKKMEEKLSQAMEVFVGRIRKMENDFLSLNKRASMLDVQLECQDLERISIVNRLGRFHGRNHAAAVEVSSASEMIPRRIFPERHVTSFAVPGNLPEGAYCLSL
ncbi:uncharacterized protein LOC133911897 isoform X2 [Phragmites australis]|uniref:uncharacterized protein LOC133911897 isoform X2 n=1 Tax=Phragmites australis TaxID=29695 RepID=UPI002D7842B3|nr:uncharacterized protein LOC133911897 isoform X2 [Phragmites australis]